MVPGRLHVERAPAAGMATQDKDAITFTVETTVAPDANGCAISSFTVTNFGTNELAVEWKEPTCNGGNMILRKAAR